MEKKKSIWLTLAGILFIAWPLFYFVRVIFISLSLTDNVIFTFLPDIPNPAFFFQKLLFVACGVGILMLKKWARMLALIISLFGIVIWIIAIVFKSPVPLASKMAHLIFYVLLGYFFSLPKIKEQFK